MTAAERRLASLAALFAPGNAADLLARLPERVAAEAVAFAGRLASTPRRERLEILADALRPDRAAIRDVARAAAARERPCLAALLLALGEGEPPSAGAAPWILRLCRERIAR